jgi:putative hydrolase of the HAD superfamily
MLVNHFKPMFESVTVIAFDLDDTLWPCMPTIDRAERETYRWLQRRYPKITEQYDEEGLFEFRKAFMNSADHYRIDLSLMRRDMLAALAREFDYNVDAVAEEGFELFYRLRHDVEFYDDVFPVLDRLKPYYQLGSISNGNASAGLTELNGYLDFFINAADVMARKPDRKIFSAFCQALEIEPHECLYVGDDPEYDVVGARDAGMHTVWVNRESDDWPDHLEPAQAEISNLRQLVGLLDGETGESG